MDKDRAIQEWARGNPFLTDALLFNFLNERQGSCAIAPVPGNDIIKRYIRIGAWKRYDFALQITLQTSDSTDTTNTDNMLTARTWQEWIKEQDAAKVYPDFGPRCSQYKLSLPSDTPQMAYQNEDGLAKYQFYASLTYYEAERN